MIAVSMTPRRIERAIDVVAVVMAVSVAFALAGLTWRVFGGAGKAHAVAVPGQVARPPADMGPLVQIAPFGTAGSGGAPSGPTSLPLVLKAIFLAQPLAASTVIISANGQKPLTVMTGQNAGGLGTIDSIAADHVVLNVNGQLQQLYFPARMKMLLAQAQPAAAPPGGDPAAAPATPAATPTTTPVNAVQALSAPPPANADGTAVAPPPPVQGAFLDSLGATRTSQGYRIGATPGPKLAQAGLVPGDVIQSVNGVALGGGQDGGAALQGAFASGRAQVQILRGGKQITMSLALR